MSLLISVNVGLPSDVAWQGKVVHTAVWKRAVPGRVMARRLNLDGDGQGDLEGHGGEHRAVMVYQIKSYRYWENYLDRRDFKFGQFGENVTVDGLADDEVCIGDRYRIGTAVFEVTQPRVTCYRVGIRMGNPQMPSLLVAHKRPGFYFRVIEEGEIGAGDEIVKVADGPERVSVAEIDALLYLPGHPRDRLERALRIPSLSAGWKGSLQALLATAEDGGNAGLAPSAPPLAWIGFRPLRVAAIHRESLQVLSFTFESEDRNALPEAIPGQFLVFKLDLADGSPTILRSYSISGPPHLGTYRISVKRDNGLGSRHFHDSLKAGDLVQVSAPRGSFHLVPGPGPIVLLSAGIGATPLLSMLHALASTGQKSAREVWWLFGARNRREHPFAEEVQGLLGDLPNSRSFVAYSNSDATDRLGADYDAPGHLDLSSLQRLAIPKTADFYLCGPTGFLADITAALKSWSIPASRIHSETFGAGSSITPGIASLPARAPHPPEDAIGTGPKVSFTRSGLTVPWNPRFQSLLEFAEACDVPVKWSCRVGVCHMCESGMIDGEVKYRPEPLDRPAEGNALLCCSTPLSELQLDL